MGPSRAHGPSAGPAEADGLPKAHGPPKVHGPRVHCTPLPPLSLALPEELNPSLPELKMLQSYKILLVEIMIRLNFSQIK